MSERKILKELLGKIIDGALFGIGFGLIVGVIFYYVNYTMTESLQERWDIQDKVIIKQSEEVKRGSETLILGSLVNQAPQSVSGVSVQVDFFDESGKFVDQCSQYIKGQIHPKEEINFKVSCGCNNSPSVDHASYKIKAIGI